MSEYWVSKKKYFCKYCEIYIADDAPSRTQHESGLRHKGNKDRFVRNLYKQGEKKKKDAEEEAREIARIEQAANAAYSQDIAAGRGSSSSTSSLGKSVAGPSSSAAASSSRKPAAPSSKFADYSTAQSLGYTDPDAERIAAEEARRRSQGVAGEWQVVVPPPPPLPEANENAGDVKQEEDASQEAAQQLPQKRELEQPVDPEDTRRFKVQRKTLAVGLGELWDPGDVPIKLKVKKPVEESATKEEDLNFNTLSADGPNGQSAQPVPSEKPKWVSKGWKRAEVDDVPVTEEQKFDPAAVESPGTSAFGSNPPNSDTGATSIVDSLPLPNPDDSPAVKQEDSSNPEVHVKSEEPPSKLEPEAPVGGIFKRRKVPAGRGSSNRAGVGVR